MTSLSVIIPAFNEEDTVGNAVKEVLAIQDALAVQHIDLTVVVVNDGSTDETENSAKAAGAHLVLNHPTNLGVGAAVRTGLATCVNQGSDIALKIDADLQHDAQDIFSLISPILNNQADVVYGNRFARINYKMPLIRRVGNSLFTSLMRWLTGWPIVDSQPGIFAIKSQFLRQFHLPGDYNYTQQVLINAFHSGMRFDQVPVEFRERTRGRSFISLRYPFKVIPQLLRVLIGIKPLKVFAPVGFAFLVIALIVSIHDLSGWIIGNSAKPIQKTNLVLGFGFFGLQTLFLGLLADLIVSIHQRDRHL